MELYALMASAENYGFLYTKRLNLLYVLCIQHSKNVIFCLRHALLNRKFYMTSSMFVFKVIKKGR